MAHYSLYTSDGEGPVQVAAMYQDADGEWQVSDDTVTLQFYDPWDGEQLGPAVQDERYNEVFKTYTTVQGVRKKKSAGFRYALRLEWPTGTLANRGTITGLANIGVGTRVRVWPHNDYTNIHYDCIVVDKDVSSKEHVEGIRYPSYTPKIEFEGVYLLKFIPHDMSNYGYYLIDKTVWGAYLANQELRKMYFIDKAQWTLYTDTERRYFTAKNIEIQPGA